MTWKPMLSWWFKPMCVVPQVSVAVPEFKVNLPSGEFPLKDIDLLANPASSVAIGTFGRRSRFVREGESSVKSPIVIPSTYSRSDFFFGRKSVGYSLSVIAEILWMIGLPWKPFVSSMVGMTAREVHNFYSSFCLDVIRQCLQIDIVRPHPLLRKLARMPMSLSLMIYRSRRATAPAPPTDPMGNLTAFVTEPTSQQRALFCAQSYRDNGTNFALARQVSYENDRIKPLQSIKSTCLLTTRLGGYNRVVGVLCDLGIRKEVIPLLKNQDSHTCSLCPKRPDREMDIATSMNEPSPFDKRPDAESLYIAAVHQRNEWYNAFNVSVLLLCQLTRPLIAFSVQLNERAMKDRTPNIVEGFAQTVASGISTYGYRLVERAFPIEFRKRGPVTMLKANWYKSGDYKDSTSWILHEAGRVAWRIILDNSPVPHGIKGLFVQCLRKLIGPHTFFCDYEEREKMRNFLYPEDFIVPDSSASLHRQAVNLGTKYRSRYGWSKQFKNSNVGFRTPQKELVNLGFREFSRRLACLPDMIKSRKLTSCRGILMSYRIAAPALMVLNAIPHWELKSLKKGRLPRFYCSGDDNVSSHFSKQSIRSLEKRKEKSGMKVHDKLKAFESQVGFILTEDLYIEVSDSAVLKKIPNFPIRCLYPERNSERDFLEVPANVCSNLKEIRNLSFLNRLTALLEKRYRRQYGILRRAGVSVCGKHSILRWMPYDNLPYTRISVPGLYEIGYSKGVNVNDLSQFMTARKSHASDATDTSDPYVSRRCTKKDVESILSSVPLISPYREKPPFLLEPVRDGVREVLGNLERHINKGCVRNYSVAISRDGKTTYSPIVTKDKIEHLDREIRDAIIADTFHSDVAALARGVYPTSLPFVDLSFHVFSQYREIHLVDWANLFGKREGYPKRTNDGGLSDFSIIVLQTLKQVGWYREVMMGVVHIVLEQPGEPRYISAAPMKALIISRPRRIPGADGEIRALYNIYQRFGKTPIVHTGDKKLLRRLGISLR